VLQRYTRGAKVMHQGEIGTSFFVIANGEVNILIAGVGCVRTLGKNAYIGERALLFNEPRSATIEIASNEADLWFIDKSTFQEVVKGNMLEDLMSRIRLQDTNFEMKALKHINIIGAGAGHGGQRSVVRLVQHSKTNTRYALKRVKKQNGQVPASVLSECAVLKENDHPFIMCLVKTFETKTSFYMLTELCTGGELHGAIRTIPSVLNRYQAQFYISSLVLTLQELSDRLIVFRDLKPEHVMLDSQGYIMLIDFYIAKKLDEGKSRTFTMIGTPHYMAPEVMRGIGYSTEIDIWALGVVMFEMVCGSLPFGDEIDEPTEICTAVLKDPLKFPNGYKDRAGRELMSEMMCRHPKKRIGSGMNGFEDIKTAEWFSIGFDEGALFNQILGRKLDAPVVGKREIFCDPEDVADILLSDCEELCPVVQ